MSAAQRTQVFYGALVLAVVFVIAAILYATGHMFYPKGVHYKHAILAIVLAVGSLAVANFNRPSAVRV